MLMQDWNEIERRAKHLWSVERHPMATAAFWAISQRNGSDSPFDYQLEQLYPTENELYHHLLALIALGRDEQADQVASSLKDLNPDLVRGLGRWKMAKEGAQ